MAQNKIALVTGGGRGLGKDTALSLAKKGIDVVLTYNSNQSAADEVVQEIQAMGQRAATLRLDMEDVTGFDAFVSELQKLLKSMFDTATIDFSLTMPD